MMQSSNQTFSGPGPDAAYAAALADGKFLIQRCGACAEHVFYPRLLCPHCGAADLNWIEPSGEAVVYSVTIVRRKAEAGGDYNVVLVDLAEGPRLMARVDGVDPQRVRIGMPVRARVIDDPRQGKMLVFVPGGAA